MKHILGSPPPLFPSSGYLQCKGEALEWTESDLGNWNLYFTLQGAGEVSMGERLLNTREGDLLLFPPDLPRSYRVSAPTLAWEFYWLHFRPNRRLRSELGWFARGKVFRTHVPGLSTRMEISGAMEEINRLNLQSPNMPHRGLLVETLINAVLLRIAAATSEREGAMPHIDERIASALEHMHRGLEKPHAVDDLARAAGLSRSQFCLLFRKGTGLSPKEYLERRRMDLAAFYLKNSAMQVSQIASAVGYAEPFYFTNRFRAVHGMSPSRYRQQSRP